MTAFAGGLALGAASSVHCGAMCGPLVAVMTRGRRPVVYHAGRLATYVTLGAVASSLGRTAAAANGERVLAVAIGATMLAAAMASSLRRRLAPASAVRARMTAALSRLAAQAYQWRDRRPFVSALLLGGVNGLLPCGLVYAATATAAALADRPLAAIFMAGFGAGTLPILAAASIVCQAGSARARAFSRQLAPIAVATAGVLLLSRGLGGHDMPSRHHSEPVRSEMSAHGPE